MAHIAGVFFFTLRGDMLLSRIYRPEVPKNVADTFRHEIVGKKPGTKPLRLFGGASYLYVRNEDLYIVAIVARNANTALVYQFIYQLLTVFKVYFGEFKSTTLRANYVLVFELLDEVLDYGHPQIMEPDSLKLIVPSDAEKKRIESLKKRGIDVTATGSAITITATGAQNWRPPNIVYKKNEIFLDIIEHMNYLLSAKGQVLRIDVDGAVKIKCKLSGMPECSFAFSDKFVGTAGGKRTHGGGTQAGGRIPLDGLQFHRCVKLTHFAQDRRITFVPPDGDFELVRYRTTTNLSPPFRVYAVVNYNPGDPKYVARVTVKATYSQQIWASDVVVLLPVPPSTASTQIRVTHGRAKHNPSKEGVLWHIKRFPGQADATIVVRATLHQSSQAKRAWTRPPLTVKFSVPHFTVSGVRVRYLRIIESDPHYAAVKWVRYLSKAGSFQVRI